MYALAIRRNVKTSCSEILSVHKFEVWDINTTTSRPAYDDFLAVGVKAKIPPVRCRELYEQVRENII